MLAALWALPGAAGNAGVVDAKVEQARQLNLAAHPTWLRLGHYRARPTGGMRSLADGPDFFVSPKGKTSPSAELEATLAAFFVPVDEALPDAEGMHPSCRFPARRAWLMERLRLSEDELPLIPCPKLDAFVQRVAARGVTFSFSSYYLGNPSSVFGHTFLRLDKDLRTADGKERELLDWGVNFAAEADTQNPVLHALKGLSGSFKGTWSHLPYFYKTREYNDFESRDVWEYRLALSPDEVQRFVLHLWELGSTWFDYYYLDENCSWHLLAALEAAAPRLELTRHLKPGVLPGDSVRALFMNHGLVESVRYRPSVRSQFERRVAKLDASGLGTLRALEQDPDLALEAREPLEEAELIDATVDYLDLLHAKELIFDQAPEAAARRHRLLVRRAKLKVSSPELERVTPLGQAPHRSHGSSRLGLSAGFGPSGAFARYHYRPYLHDLIDPPAGYPGHTGMEVSSLTLRFDVEPHRLSIEQWDLLRISNLAPYTRFEPRPAWMMAVGARTVQDGGCDNCLVGTGEWSGGLSVEPLKAPLVLFALFKAELAAGPRLSGLWGGPVRPSAGPLLGLRWHLGDRLSTLAQVGGLMHFEAQRRLSWGARFTSRIHFSSGFSLELDLRRTHHGAEAAVGAFFLY